ncbi:MAG: TolC family protein [Bacteroidota bacterium]
MKKLSLLVWILTIVGTAQSQQSLQVDSGIPVGLREAIDAALSRNPVMQASRARVDAAVSREREVRSALFPHVRFSGRFAQLSEVPEFSVPFLGPDPLFPSITRSTSARVSVQQTLFSGFRILKSAEAAGYQSNAAGADLERDRADLILNVTTAYWQLSLARRVEEVLARTVEQIEAHVRDVENFRGQGMATEADILKVKTRSSDVKVRHIEARSNVRLAAMRLNSLMGSPLDTPVVPGDEPPADDDPILNGLDLRTVVERARGQRFELLASRERVLAQEAAVSAAGGGWYPQILLAAGYDYARPNPRIVPPKDRWETSWDVGVTVQWNIWDWFATAGRTAQARAGLAQAEAGFAQTSDAVALDAAQQYFRTLEARERIGVARWGTSQAEESYRITREMFRQNLASNSDLLDAETALLQAQLTSAQAAADYAVQRQRLRRAIGVRE